MPDGTLVWASVGSPENCLSSLESQCEEFYGKGSSGSADDVLPTSLIKVGGGNNFIGVHF